MLLNRFEYHLMNNPIRAGIQRWIEGPTLRRLGGSLPGARVLELGCGRGIGVQVIRRCFPDARVDAFDLDRRMVRTARRRLAERVRGLWVGDAAILPLRGASYDAVFDFGILHHVPDWRAAVAEIARVLRPGGRLYAEEVLAPFIDHPLARAFFEHPRQDRFDAPAFAGELENVGLTLKASRSIGRSFAWFVADRHLWRPPSVAPPLAVASASATIV